MPPLVSTFDEPTARHFDDSTSSLKEYQPEGCVVRFNMECRVHTVPDISEYTDEEIENLWFSTAEFKKLKSKRRVIERMMLSGRFQESDTSDDYCFRGIETAKDREFRLSRRQRVGRILIAEQINQAGQGIRDPERLRNVLIEHTAASAAEARERAQKDSLAIGREVAQVCDADEPCCLIQIGDLDLEELVKEELAQDDMDDNSVDDDCSVDSIVLVTSPRKQRKGLRRLLSSRNKGFFMKSERKN